MRLAVVVATVLAAALATGRAPASELSPYERETLRDAVASEHGVVDPAPEGKIVEAIDVVAVEVIERRDPAPRFLNIFHATTRDAVIRREAQLRVGERYRQDKVDETVRDLRSFQQLSLVLAAPLAGSAPDRVRLLLVTKDVWSLRSQFQIRLGSSGLDLLRLEPTERNIAGTLDSVLGRFELYPETLTLGGGYYVPRLFGRQLYFVSDANVVLTRDTGDPEGTYGNIGVFTPQISADQPWVWQYGMRWSNTMVRRYVGAKLVTFDAQATPADDAIPDAFRARKMTQAASVVRSFGFARKMDVMLGAEVNVAEYQGLDPSRYDPRVVEEYRAARVPTSDDRAGPFAQIRLYENRFVKLHDFDLLALEEDYRVGYDAWARVYPVTRALGSSRDFFGVDAFAQYILPLGTGFMRASSESLLELGPERVPTAGFAVSAAAVGPSLPFGRILVDGVALDRPRNYLNQRSVLGGEGRLRGYPSQAFLGENVLAFTTELRTKPVEILACQIGGAVFHDIGDAYDGDAFAPKSSVGVGVRALFPQLDRRVWRFDVAFPLARRPGDGAGPVAFYLAFEQAFPATVVVPPAAAPPQAILNPTGGALGQ